MKRLAYIVLAVLVGCGGSSGGAKAPDISALLAGLSFSDPALRQCVHSTVTSRGIESIAELTDVSCTSQAISSLQGIEALTELIKLDLSANLITDINPLKSLSKLAEVKLAQNYKLDCGHIQSFQQLHPAKLTGHCFKTEVAIKDNFEVGTKLGTEVLNQPLRIENGQLYLSSLSETAPSQKQAFSRILHQTNITESQDYIVKFETELSYLSGIDSAVLAIGFGGAEGFSLTFPEPFYGPQQPDIKIFAGWRSTSGDKAVSYQFSVDGQSVHLATPIVASSLQFSDKTVGFSATPVSGVQQGAFYIRTAGPAAANSFTTDNSEFRFKSILLEVKSIHSF